MSSNTTKFVSADRVIEILECYGANSNAWPEDERAAALSVINKSDSLQQCRMNALRLDESLQLESGLRSLNSRATTNIVANIVDKLPKHELVAAVPKKSQQTKVSYFNSSSWHQYLAVAAVAVMLLSTVFFVKDPLINQPETTYSVSQSEFDQWIWREVTGISNEDNDSETPTTFMALIDMESDSN